MSKSDFAGKKIKDVYAFDDSKMIGQYSKVTAEVLSRTW